MVQIARNLSSEQFNIFDSQIYKKVDNTKRMTLLKLVRDHGKSLKEAARILEINYSTAKTILRVFRLENRILKKSAHQKRERKLSINLSRDESLHSQNSTNLTANNAINPTENRFYSSTEKALNQFKSMVTVLQSCINEVISNEIMINNINTFMSARFNNFNNNISQ